MQISFFFMTMVIAAAAVVWPCLIAETTMNATTNIATVEKTVNAPSFTIESGTNDDNGDAGAEYDNESARKIIGSRVVTSVSVVMNGKEPQFADAAGNYVPRPLVPPRVASPINLLNPDRYEFYTFNDDGELVKRLMTMKEIQSIVANGDSEQQVLAKNPTGIVDAEADIRDIVNNVQKVLHKEMESNHNFTANLMNNKLDTPDTSSSWSSILPAIFGNTGEPILSSKMPSMATTAITPNPMIVHVTKKKPIQENIKTKIPQTTTTTSSKLTTNTTPTKLTKQKPKPSRPATPSAAFATGTTLRPFGGSTQKIKISSPGAPVKVTNKVKNTLSPIHKQQQQSTTLTSKPSKFSSQSKPSTYINRTPSKTTTSANAQKWTQALSSTARIPIKTSNKISAAPLNIIPTNKPLHLVGTKSEVTVKRPNNQNKFTNSAKPSTVSPPSSTYSFKTTQNSPTVTTTTKKNNRITEAHTVPALYTFADSQLIKKKTSNVSKLKTKTTSHVPSTTATERQQSKLTSATSSFVPVELITTSTEPITKKSISTPSSTTNFITTEQSDDVNDAAITTEPDNIFDSELSLNQIIESLKNIDATTIPYAQNFMDVLETTTFDSNSMAPPAFENVNTESVTVYNNGQDSTTRSKLENRFSDFKQSMSNSVTYIPQTTIEHSPDSVTQTFDHHANYSDDDSTVSTVRSLLTEPNFSVQHKESANELENNIEIMTVKEDASTESSFSKPQTNSLDNLLRESFDNVLLQVQTDGTSTTADYNDAPSTTILSNELITHQGNEKKKLIVKPTPNISLDDLHEEGTEPMKYFESIIKQYEKEKEILEKNHTSTNFSTSTPKNPSTTDSIPNDSDADRTTESEIMFTTTNEVYQDETSQSFQTETKIDSTEKYSTEDYLSTTELSTEDYSMESMQTENLLNIISDETTSISYEEISTIAFERDSTERQVIKLAEQDISTTQPNDDSSTTTSYESETDINESQTMQEDQTTNFPESNESDEESLTKYEMIELIENVSKEITINDTSTGNKTNVQLAQNLIERKEDSQELEVSVKPTTESQNLTSKRDENEFLNLGETTMASVRENVTSVKENSFKTPIQSVLSKIQNTLALKLPHPTLSPILNNLKMKVVNSLKNSHPINLDPAPKQALGLEESTANANEDILEFTKFCNQLAFDFWDVLNNDGISSARSLVLSPFALTSMLAMLFLGARGRTSSEINDMLHLDDIVTFNPHALFRNITESVESGKEANIVTSAFVREIFSDRSKGKILSFYKEKVQQFYSGYVEEVNFSTVNDIIRRRTNLLVKRHTANKVIEYLKTNNVWVKAPLSGISANIYETDCSNASKDERDGEMFFQVLPAIRQRRLVPIPAAVWKNGFTAGYDPELDATAVAIGLSDNVVSAIFVMPGQQGHSAPGDNLERLESVLMVNAVTKNAWRRLLATLMVRPGLEVQIPRFTHRSFVNTTNSLHKLGLKTLFDQASADLRGITGSITRDMFVSDLVQINMFSTCGEDKLAEEHHVEMYPAPPNKYRTMYYDSIKQKNYQRPTKATTTTTTTKGTISSDFDNQRAFSDPLFDLKYLNLPLPLRPRQARVPEAPRLRFDKPFIYMVRHNPTGMVLYMGRFNPRLLP